VDGLSARWRLGLGLGALVRGGGHVLVDPAQFGQVVLNLAANAPMVLVVEDDAAMTSMAGRARSLVESPRPRRFVRGSAHKNQAAS